MRRAALLVLALASCATWASTGSVYRAPCVHAGLRPADLSQEDEVDDWGVTLRVRAPLLEPCVADAGLTRGTSSPEDGPQRRP